MLGLLKERGELNGKGSLRAVEWAGRTNDMKPVALQVSRIPRCPRPVASSYQHVSKC